MPNAAATRTGLAPAMRPGTLASAAPLMPMNAAMMTSGMRIEMIVRGWRSRRESETCSAVISSSGSTGADADASAGSVSGRAGTASRPGLISIAPDATGPPGPPAIGRRSSPPGSLIAAARRASPRSRRPA